MKYYFVDSHKYNSVHPTNKNLLEANHTTNYKMSKKPKIYSKGKEAMLLSTIEPTLGSIKNMLDLPKESKLLSVSPGRSGSLIVMGLLKLDGYQVGNHKKVSTDQINQMTISPTKEGLKWISENKYSKVLPVFALIDGCIASSYVEIGGHIGSRFFTTTTVFKHILDVLGPGLECEIVRNLIKSILRSKKDKQEISKHLEGNRVHKEPVYTSAYVVGQVLTALEEEILQQAGWETVSLERGEGVCWEGLPMEMQLQIVKRLPGDNIPFLRLVSSNMKSLADDPELRKKLYLVVTKGTDEENIITQINQKEELFSVTLSEEDTTETVLDMLVAHPSLTIAHFRAGPQSLHIYPWHHPLYKKAYTLLHSGEVQPAWRVETLRFNRARTKASLKVCCKSGSVFYNILETIWKMLS